MGVVNNGNVKIGACHMSLSDINNEFTADTPIYLVVNAMKFDSAEYCVDTTDTLSFSGDNFGMWMCYPEKGKLHVSISTTTNMLGQRVRTVKCITKNGKVYTNVFTKNDSPIFDKGSKRLCFDDFINALQHSMDASTELTTNGTKILQYADYDNSKMTNKELFSSGRLFDVGLGLIDGGAPQTLSDETCPIINTVSYNELIALCRVGCDVQTIPYIMSDIYLYNLEYHRPSTHPLISYIPESYVITSGGEDLAYDIFTILSIYRITRNWRYSGWRCVETAPVEYGVCTYGSRLTREDSSEIYEGDDSVMWTGNLSDDIHISLLGDYNSYMFASNENYDMTVANTHSYRKIVTGYSSTIDTLKSIRAELDKIAPNIPFQPFESSVRTYHVNKSIYETDTSITDIFCNLPTNLCVDSSIDLSSYKMVNITFTIDGSDMTLHVNMSYNCDGGGLEVLNNDTDIKFLKDIWGMLPVSTIDVPAMSESGETRKYIAIGNDAYTSCISDAAPLYDLVIEGKTVVEEPTGIKTSANTATLRNTQPSIYSINQNILAMNTINWSNDILDPTVTDDDGDPISGTCSEYIEIPEHSGDINISCLGVEYICTYNDSKTLIETFRSEKDRINISVGSDAKYVRVLIYNFSTDHFGGGLFFNNSDSVPQVKHPCVTIPELMSIGDIKDKLYRHNNTWYIDKRVHKAVISCVNDTIYLNNTEIVPIYDSAASTPSSNIYVFHLASETATNRSGYGVTTPTNDSNNSLLPGMMVLHSGLYADGSDIISINADTTKDIPCGYSVTNDGATPVSDVNEYAIQIQDNDASTVSAIQFDALTSDPFTPLTECKYYYDWFDTGNASFMHGYCCDYDSYGNESVFRYPKLVTIAVKLTATDDHDAIISALKAKILDNPIIFYYCPKFSYNDVYWESGRHTTINPLDTVGDFVGTSVVSHVPMTFPVNRDIQAQLQNLRIYKDGFIKIITPNGVCGKISIRYAKDICRIIENIESRLQALE